MIVVTFKLHGKPGNQVEINQSLKGIAVKVKKLDGCKDTKVYQDLDGKNIFLLAEIVSICWSMEMLPLPGSDYVPLTSDLNLQQLIY